MIPSATGFLDQEFELEEQPTHTYKIDRKDGRIRGYTDELEAMRQAIHKILSTERFQYIMYSGNYGIELQDLYGQPVSYVCPELKRRISEALLWDKRIKSLTDFEFDIPKKGVVHVAFTAHTVLGDVRAEREVNF